MSGQPGITTLTRNNAIRKDKSRESRSDRTFKESATVHHKTINWDQSRPDSQTLVRQYLDKPNGSLGTLDFYETDYPAIGEILTETTTDNPLLSAHSRALLPEAWPNPSSGTTHDRVNQVSNLKSLFRALGQDIRTYEQSRSAVWESLQSTLPVSWYKTLRRYLSNDEALEKLKQARACVQLGSSIAQDQGSLPGFEDTLRAINSLLDAVDKSGIDTKGDKRTELLNGRDLMTNFYREQSRLGGLSQEDIDWVKRYVSSAWNVLNEDFSELPRGVGGAEYAQAYTACNDILSRVDRDFKTVKKPLSRKFSSFKFPVKGGDTRHH